MKGCIYMSINELSRLELIIKIIEKKLKQSEAADILGVGIRQIKRLVKKYRFEGALGLISKKRGSPGNHCLSKGLKELALGLIVDQYGDFGPTLAQEKLKEVDNLEISVSTVRSLMIEKGLRSPQRLKKKRVFQYRDSRSRKGEMMQMDGSPHDWFEGRAAKCSLIYTVDDATGEIMAARFEPTETMWGYFELMKDHLKIHCRPIALYTDKHGVFKVNHKDAVSGDGITQFGKAMKALDIKIIYANTPQAKGRIQRMNQTLQDRLVKELRLQKISTPEEVNAYLPTFIKDFNSRFPVVPKDPNNAHRELLSEHDLNRIFIIKENRTLTKNLTFQHKNTIYQVQTNRETCVLRKARIVIYEFKDESIEAFYKEKNSS
jgi:transposase